MGVNDNGVDTSGGDVAVKPLVRNLPTEYPNRGHGLPETMLATGTSFPSGMVLGLLVGAAVGGGLIFIALGYIFIRKCLCRRKIIDIDETSGLQTRSAPVTRNSSPRPSKKEQRRSSSSSQNMLVRSVTVDMIPDFILPPERVQPKAPLERRCSESGLQYTYGMLGSVQPDLYSVYSPVYKRDCGNVLSNNELNKFQYCCDRAYDEDTDEMPPSAHGRLWFSLVYDAAVQQLTVSLIKAKGLKSREKTSAPRDPFVKLYLLPDERTCQESRVKKRTLTPKFNESFAFQVSESEVTSRTLRFSVYDVDKRRVRHSLGHVIVPLSDVDLMRGDVMWKDLESLTQTSFFSLGELQLSLTYTPISEKIKVVVHGCRNLRKLEYGADDGVYARIQLMHGQRVYKTKRTESQQGTCDLVYNESFTFTLPPKQLDTCSIHVALMTSGQGRLSGPETEYGGVTVGPFMYARGEELLHWQKMVGQARVAVSQWHSLSIPK